MGDLADAFLSLPGGIGTLDELFETLSWSQVGLQRKPNALLNVAGFYDALVAHLDRAARDGYIRAPHRGLLTIGSEPAPLLDECTSSRCARRDRNRRMTWPIAN
jgi:uncharacterized protein (TIGR00730 family)